jgi:hypothetical protein
MHDDNGKINYCLYHDNAFLEGVDVAGNEFLSKIFVTMQGKNRNKPITVKRHLFRRKIPLILMLLKS